MSAPDPSVFVSGVPVPKYEPHAVNDPDAGLPVVYPAVPNVVKFP